jgi:heptosyltransferase-2
VLRFGSVGDVVLTSPAMEALRLAWPRSRILFVVKEALGPLVAQSPDIDEVLHLMPGEGPERLARRLREGRVNVVIDLHGKLRSRLVRPFLPGVRWVGWHNRDLGETLAVKLALRPYHATTRFADRYHAAIEKAVGRDLPRGRLRYIPSSADRAEADRVLQEGGVVLDRPLLGISPGARWATKRWPVERFGVIAARARAAGLQVVVQGVEDERTLTKVVCDAAPGTLDLTGRLGLGALGGLIARCSAFLTNDSGPMHMARALGVPTLALFGSTDPAMFEFAGHRALSVALPCSPCSFFGRASCPQGHFRCMRDLDDKRVWEALQPLLADGRRELLSG